VYSLQSDETVYQIRPSTFTAHGVSCVGTQHNILQKWNKPPLSYWRFSALLLCNFRGKTQWQCVLVGAWTHNLLNLRHRAIIPALHCYFRDRIPCCIFKRWPLKVKWFWKRRQISHFL